MLEAKSFSIHGEPASSRWAVYEIAGGPFLVPYAGDIECGYIQWISTGFNWE